MRHTVSCASVFLVLLTLAGCDPDTAPETIPEAGTELALEEIPKIDVHTHYSYARDYLVPLLEEWNMRAVVVDVVREPGRQRWQAMLDHYEQASEHLILCTSFDASRIDEPNFAEEVIAGLEEDLVRGAKMVKVWKNIGMVYKDAEGNFIQIDDARFQPIWDFLAEQGVPVMAHIGEPRAAWLPLDEEDPHYDYYANHPEYHAYKSQDVPDWETIIAARDRWLEQNPELTVIGAHLGSMAYDVDEVARRLDRYPNFYVETAERFGDLVGQPSEKVRDFFITYQDRVLYGTDLGTRAPQSELSEAELQEEREDLIERRLRLTWDYVTGADSLTFVRTGTPFQARTKGLDLPREVVEKFYYRNAARLLDLQAEEPHV